MTDLIGVFLILLAIGAIALMWRQHSKGIHPLLSLRNFAIVGFIIYQLISPGRALLNDEYGDYPLLNPATAGLIFTAMLLVFVFCFGFFYRRGWGIDAVTRRLPVPTGMPTGFAMVILAAVLTVMGFVFRFVLGYIPIFGVVADKWGMAFAVMAVGIVGWTWASRFWNPAMILYVGLILGINTINLVMGSFGRRPLVAVGAALLWGLFWAGWRFLPSRSLALRIAIIAIGPVLLVGLYTGAREAQEFDRSAAEQIQEMATASLSEGLLDLFSGQQCGPISMWLIESYPERFEYKHLMALRYLVILPIPRTFWEEKPEPLSTKIAREASLTGVNRDVLKIGPGVIGHIAAEGGWYALILYAFVGAWILRLGDTLVWQNADKPLVVCALGSSMGDCMGLSRGEISAFMFNFLMAVVGAYFFGLLISRYFAQPGEVHEEWLEDERYADEHFDVQPGPAT